MSYLGSIKLKDYPEFRDVVRAVSPGYRKHGALLTHTDTVTPNGTYWDGGTISHYYCFDHGRVYPVPAPTAPPQFGGGKPEAFKIPPGAFVVSVGTFCGKPATAHIYTRKDKGS